MTYCRHSQQADTFSLPTSGCVPSPVGSPDEHQCGKELKQSGGEAALLHELDRHLVPRRDAELDLRVLQLPLKTVQGADVEVVPDARRAVQD